MSRQIDLSKPLSDADRAYLRDRCRFADIAEADANGVAAPEVPEVPEVSDVAAPEQPADVPPTSKGATK